MAKLTETIEWIDVRELLPEPSQHPEVMAVRIGSGHSTTFLAEYFLRATHHFTHWAPMPTGPKSASSPTGAGDAGGRGE